ncbi:MAG: hypothetical protein J6A25_00770 [Lachnospiraceae bacterium]|nr:hypothetical protein [Lachnospiraceae bacterium]
MSDIIDTPQIVTTDTLNTFKEELLSSIGLKIGNKSLIQTNNTDTIKVTNSAIFGMNHKVDSDKGLKNVLISGQNNIVSTWNQTVLGQFNKANPNALFILGNGAGDLNRNNAFEILKNGNIKIGPCELAVSGGKLVSTNKFAYDSTILGDELDKLDSFAKIKDYVDTMTDDTELISIGILKKLLNYIPTETGLTPENIAELIPENGLSLEPEDPAAKQKALSIADALALKSELIAISNEARYNDLLEKLTRLEKNVSYLISCLTVDKIANADGSIEYYAVGLADYALDMDTPFTFASDSTDSENTTQTEGDTE